MMKNYTITGMSSNEDFGDADINEAVTEAGYALEPK